MWQTASPPLVRMIVRDAAPAPGGSGGSFSSRACLIAPVYVGAAWEAVKAREGASERP